MDPTTVLVVEGESLVRQALARVLTEAGYAVVAAGDELATLAALNEQPIDAVIADVATSHVDGIELLAAVRAQSPKIPVVLMTEGNGDLSSFRLPILTKPFDVGALLALLPRRTPDLTEDRLLQLVPS